MNINWQDAALYFYKYLDHYSFLFPIGIFGIWRWSVWLFKEAVGFNYHPDTRRYSEKVSLVTPVYNEDPVIFQKALNSWRHNKVQEIIAVIDYTDTRCITLFKEFSKKNKGNKLIITKTPGKRPALADGIKAAKHPIIALVDSDTIWANDTLVNGLPPFNDKKTAGVATYQNVLNPKTLAQKIFDTQLDIRYRLEYPFLAAAGDALVCLSGRTAFYRLAVILPMMKDLTNETFMGRPVISGDDKCLTYLVLAAGWKVAYQSNSHVYTPGMAGLRAYTSQRLRWTRNSLRADIKAMLNGWPFHHPALAFFQIDKVLQTFVAIISPLYLMVSLIERLWLPAGIIVTWWLLSRTFKMLPHLNRRPQDILILPSYILYSFFIGLLRIYAFFSLNTQGWITRWDKSRLPQMRVINQFVTYGATAAVVVFLYFGVYALKQVTYLQPLAKRNLFLSKALRTEPRTLALNNQPSVLGVSTEVKKDYSVTRYEAQNGESLQSVANKFNVDFTRLLYTNIPFIPSMWSLTPGVVLSIPGKDIPVEPVYNYNYTKVINPLVMTFEKETNTMVLSGRGQIVTLKQVANFFGKGSIVEVAPKEWYLKSSLFVGSGVTLVLDSNEVTWLKLMSQKDKFVILRGNDSNIIVRSVKITSWDAAEDTYDTNLDDGRSFVFAKGSGRMDLYNSELAYLGYPTSDDVIVSPYGVSWKVSRIELKTVVLSGEVIGSKFHHNYFGAYTFGATGMVWRKNEFYENVRYGLDPHDDSNGFLVEENTAHNNNAHGIIFSKRCMYNVIRNNYTYDNKLHGIMLHEASNNNEIYGNLVTGNTSGISLWRSSNNLVYDNTIDNNRHGIRANMASDNNVIENNRITGNTLYGVYTYEDANKNTIAKNIISQNNVGIYLKSDTNTVKDNTLTNNTTGIYITADASDNALALNKISYSGIYGIYSKVNGQVHNFIEGNLLAKNRKDLIAR